MMLSPDVELHTMKKKNFCKANLMVEFEMKFVLKIE